MSDFKRFMKQNKAIKGNTTFAATESLTDEQGKPLLWTIRPISTTENEKLQEECTVDIPTGKPNVFRPKLNSNKYLAKMICASVVEPNLYDKELQDSYGVMTPEELLKEMIDNPGEYNNFAAFIQKFNGFIPIDEKVEQAKN